MHAVVAHIDHFQQRVGREGMLEAKVPAQRVRILEFGIDAASPSGPRMSPSPADDPAGGLMPVGKGSLSVAAGVRKLLFDGLNAVVWLNPYCCRIGLVEYAPVMASCVMLTGCTNIANPARTTVLLCIFSGDHAKPMRGLMGCDC